MRSILELRILHELLDLRLVNVEGNGDGIAKVLDGLLAAVSDELLEFLHLTPLNELPGNVLEVLQVLTLSEREALLAQVPEVMTTPRTMPYLKSSKYILLGEYLESRPNVPYEDLP